MSLLSSDQKILIDTSNGSYSEILNKIFRNYKNIKIINNKPTTIININPINSGSEKTPIFIIVKDQPEALAETVKYFHLNIKAPNLIFIHDRQSTNKETIKLLTELEEKGNKVCWQQNCDNKLVQIAVDAWLQNNEEVRHYFITDSLTSFIKQIDRK